MHISRIPLTPEGSLNAIVSRTDLLEDPVSTMLLSNSSELTVGGSISGAAVAEVAEPKTIRGTNATIAKILLNRKAPPVSYGK